MTFKCKFEGLILPLFGSSEMDWPNPIRVILYLIGLGWCFLGVAVISDVFMAGIEKVTSWKKRVKNKTTGRTMTVYVWNATVANLTLMALGSSAPEILLSLIEISSDEFFLGPLGAGTIVGSAAFNLLCISAACVAALPDGEVRKIDQIPVYVVTASCSVFAYLWLMFILMATSPDVCNIWEAVLTLLFCPILVFVAYMADRGKLNKLFCIKDGDYAEQDDSADKTIPDDVTEEELLQIEADIRKEHGANLTQEQVVKIMRVSYFNRNTRAHYRHIAMESALNGKKVDMTTQSAEYAVQEVLNTVDDIDAEKARKTVVFGFAACKYAYTESVGKAKVVVFRRGPSHCQASVYYKTEEGTASNKDDYEDVEGTLVFEKGETEKEILIPIMDDEAFEQDEHFFVKLSDPKVVDSASCGAQMSKFDRTQVVIIDDDMPGELRFAEEEHKIDAEGNGEQTIEVEVQRFNGATGKISCTYATDTMNAVEGVDFDGAKGTVEFESGQQTARIPIVVKCRERVSPVSFNVVISDPVGTKFDDKTDGGADQCICHYTINANGDKTAMFAAMKERIASANSINGHKNWAQQFKDALFSIGDDDDDEDGEGGEGEAKEGPSAMDYFMHIIAVPWKLLFAFVPPVDYCGGWACFFGALVMIGGVTALVGDMANLVGCCFDVLPETAAITFVALGTSLPDTFASMAAAKMDPHADASIGNVTGSNSVNVFLGVGLAWALAAFKWETGGVSDEWIKRVIQMEYSLVESLPKPSPSNDNVRKAMSGTCKVDINAKYGISCSGNAVFVTPGGTLWFNLMVFSVNAFCALQHLEARRKKWGGELGGPKKGFFGQYFSASFLVFQWFIYIVASIIFARVNGGLTYTDIADNA